MLKTRLNHSMQFARLDPLFHGFAQIGFQQNRLSGLLFIIAIALGSPLMLLAALAAVGTAYLTASWLGADRKDLQAGLYGYNPALMAIALVIWLPLSWSLVLMVLAGGAVTALIMYAFRQHSRIPPYSVPFILTAWLMLLLSLGAGMDLNTPALLNHGGASVFEAFLSSVGQVGFQQGALSGALILAALLVGSLAAGGWAILAAVVSLVLAPLLSPAAGLIDSGIFGFNAILATLVLSGLLPQHRWKAVVILSAITATVVLTAVFLQLGIIAFTAPFVMTVYLIQLAIRQFCNPIAQ
ncbi:urea transporter [Marinobacterium jannaschii]|uniref:urea transporter n=1 Tax=Marinobacterium jannaschii TaxID=64970 RepID=UPI0012EB9359|nr:urea transporter [Marinobacterium jannaschii]